MAEMGRPLPDHSQLQNSSSGSNGDSSQDARSQALKLMKEKGDLQAELDALHSGLQDSDAELGKSLFDNEGFPRGDIDVYTVRLQRVRVIELRNDIKHLSERIKSLLEIALARPDASTKVNQAAESAMVKTPFALCNGVAPGSPAAEAGMLRGDKILRFGSINATNHEGLRAVAGEVKEGRTITILVSRKVQDSQEEQEIGLALLPKAWSGRGLLGCHIVPL